MIARMAVQDDYDDVFRLCKLYLSESFYRGSTINLDGWNQAFKSALLGDAHTRLIVVDDNGVIGFALVYVSYEMINEGVGAVSLFYIDPERRNGKASVILRDEIIKVFENDIKCMYAVIACSSGISLTNNEAYSKLWERKGFSFLGTEVFTKF